MQKLVPFFAFPSPTTWGLLMRLQLLPCPRLPGQKKAPMRSPSQQPERPCGSVLHNTGPGALPFSLLKQPKNAEARNVHWAGCEQPWTLGAGGQTPSQDQPAPVIRKCNPAPGEGGRCQEAMETLAPKVRPPEKERA